MKSAIGIGTGWEMVSTPERLLTEDRGDEYGSCNRLAELAGEQLEAKAGRNKRRSSSRIRGM